MLTPMFHTLALSHWPEEDSRRISERLALLGDSVLRQVLAVMDYVCSPRASWADSPQLECYASQRELVRGELQRRGCFDSGLPPLRTRYRASIFRRRECLRDSAPTRLCPEGCRSRGVRTIRIGLSGTSCCRPHSSRFLPSFQEAGDATDLCLH